MKKIIGLLLGITIFLTGCGMSNTAELQLEKLATQAGEFQFENVMWESTVADVEAALNCKLQHMGNVESRQLYMVEAFTVYNGCTGNLNCEFDSEKLDTVSVIFKDEEAKTDAFWESLTKELFECYGEVEVHNQSSTSEELNITTECETYLWEHIGEKHTVLNASRFEKNGELKYIELAVYVVPEDRSKK